MASSVLGCQQFYFPLNVGLDVPGDRLQVVFVLGVEVFSLAVGHEITS